jgi:hypothetical protein
MFDMMPGWGYLFLAYIIGSIATFVLFYKSIVLHSIEKTIDSLCEDGYLRHRKKADGEIEILKYNHND